MAALLMSKLAIRTPFSPVPMLSWGTKTIAPLLAVSCSPFWRGGHLARDIRVGEQSA